MFLLDPVLATGHGKDLISPYLPVPDQTQFERKSGHRHRSAKRCGQEELRLLPIPPHGPVGDAEGVRDLCLSHSGEEPHFDDPDEAIVDGLQCFERLVDSNQLVVARAHVFGELRIERHMLRIAAATFRLTFARKVDDDGSHDPACIRKKLTAIGAVELACLIEAQKALVHEHRRVEQRVAPPAAKLRSRLHTQLFVRDGEQTLACRGVARLRSLQQIGELIHE